MSRIYTNGFERGDVGIIHATNRGEADLESILIIPNSEIPSLSGYIIDHIPPKYGNYVLGMKGGYEVQFCPYEVTGTIFTEIYISFRFLFTGIPYWQGHMFSLESPLGNNHVIFNDDGTYRATGWLDMGYGEANIVIPKGLSSGIWHFIELYYKLSTDRYTSDGAYDFRINGKQFSSSNAFKTNYEPNTVPREINSVVLRGCCQAIDWVLFDDFVVDSTAAFETGGGGVIRYQPTGDATTEWTPSAGVSHYTIADNRQLNRDMPTSNYLSTDTTGEDSYIIGQDGTNTFDVNSTIFSVQTSQMVSKRGYSPVDDVKSFLDIGGNKYFSDSYRVPIENYYESTYIWETNPNTLTYWTANDINNLNLGIKGD